MEVYRHLVLPEEISLQRSSTWPEQEVLSEHELLTCLVSRILVFLRGLLVRSLKPAKFRLQPSLFCLISSIRQINNLPTCGASP